MSANQTNPGPVDSSRIELNEEHELRYWTEELGCTSHQLLAALKSVGVSARAVAEHLSTTR